MPEYKKLEEMDRATQLVPNWVAEWGPEFGVGAQIDVLNEALRLVQFLPLEDQNTCMALVRDEICPIHRRWQNTIGDEVEEAQAVAAKYNHEETGLWAVMARDYDTAVETLPTRYPALWPHLKELLDNHVNAMDMGMMRRYRGCKTFGSIEPGGPLITYNYGNPLMAHGPMMKSYQILCSRLNQRSALRQQQTQLLEQVLAENDLQLPPEFAAIQQQLDHLKRPRSEEELAQADADRAKDPNPDAKLLEVVEYEGVEGSGKFVGVYQNKAKRFVMPPSPPPALGLPQCNKILRYLKTRGFIRPFMQRPTEEEAPGYSSVVTRHRDIPMLEECLSLVEHYGTRDTKYMPRVFIGDLRLMVENYLHFFEEGSHQHNAALQVENAVYSKLAEFGSLGEEGKKFFDEAVLPEFNDPEEDAPADDTVDSINDEDAPVADATQITIQDDDTEIANLLRPIEPPRPHGPSSPSSGEDNTLDMAWKGMEKAEQYDKNVGNPTQAPVRHNTQQPGASSSAQPPRPSLEEDEPAEQPAGEHSFYNQYDYQDPNADPFGPPPEGAVSAHVSGQPAPRASMAASASAIDLTSPQQRQATHTASASNGAPDDQDSSDDDAPLLEQRKTAGKLSASAAAKGKGKAPASAAASSSRKRRRDDSDGDSDAGADSDYAPEQPSKRQRKTASKGKAPAAAAAAKGKGKAPAAPAASSSRKRSRDDDGDDQEPEQSSKKQKTGSASSQQQEPEVATTALGYTDQGTITVTALHRLPKWRKKVRAANRPWVFEYGFGEQLEFGLYIMRCPSKRCPAPGCDAGPEVFSKHPLIDYEVESHLEQCFGESGGGDPDQMVRQFCKQVISDDKKAVSREWARKWNEDLIAEYGYEDDAVVKGSNV